MATDISKVGNAIQVTVDTLQPVAYAGFPITYSFNAAGNTLNISFGNHATYSVTPLANLTIAGVSPANAAAGYTALSTVVGMYP